MVLVDTSVWIDFFRGLDTPETQWLSGALEKGEDLCLCGIVLTEVLQGISAEQELKRVKSFLEPLIFLPMPTPTYGLAADIYRHAKSKGQTVKTVDCLIAACAISHEVSLLQRDGDYLVIAKFSNLKLVRA